MRLLAVACVLVGCGQPHERPKEATGSTVRVEPIMIEAEKSADLTPGAYVVVAHVGLMKVKGPGDFDGKPMMEFSNFGMTYRLDLDNAKDPKVVRAVISRAEAERRLALLEDTTPVTDTRSSKVRFTEHMRTLARGTDLDKLALLRAAYASTFAAGERNTEIYYLEEQVLPELVYVLGGHPILDDTRVPPSFQPSWKKFVERLHSVHSQRGTYAKTAKPRPPEPEPIAPTDPWDIKGHDYVGTFTVKGESLIAGDPIYVTSKHDEPAQEVTKNVSIPAAAGPWLCYLELDPEDPADVPISFIAIHDSAGKDLHGARRRAAPVTKLWVDSGRISVVDAAIRDDATYEDARLFGADDHGVIGGRGCTVSSGAGDGTYTTRVVARDGKAIYVHVDFTGMSRDFLKDARVKLKL